MSTIPSPICDIRKNEAVQKLLKNCEDVFLKKFGEKATHAAVAPGRVNLIGEHVDYCDGFVMPMAIPLYTVVVARKVPKRGYSRVISLVFEEETTISAPYDRNSDDYPSWSTYIRGVAALYPKTEDFDIVIDSTVPVGGGLSSSAALEVAILAVLRAMAGKDADNLSQEDCARLCQKAEHDYANMPCGIMDQFIVTLAQNEHALKIDCRSLTYQSVPLRDPRAVVLVINSNVKHNLTGSEYPERRRMVEEAAKTLGQASLRDVSLQDLNDQKSRLDEVAYQRARHVVSEIERTDQAAAALLSNDLAFFGELMKQSHQSLRDDFKVSCAEVDELVELANDSPGVYGSRMTGGGFGGCTVTLVQADAVDGLEAKIKEAYSGKATFYRCTAVGGVQSFQL
uniref:Galactokinase n=1 Tax=Plectus sambesii TaxID=2011161 RepID=A0A914WKM6_9BILA